jgi:hypothetical protein
MLVYQSGMWDAIDRRPKAGHFPHLPGLVVGLYKSVADLDGWNFPSEYRHVRLISLPAGAGWQSSGPNAFGTKINSANVETPTHHEIGIS